MQNGADEGDAGHVVKGSMQGNTSLGIASCSPDTPFLVGCKQNNAKEKSREYVSRLLVKRNQPVS